METNNNDVDSLSRVIAENNAKVRAEEGKLPPMAPPDAPEGTEGPKAPEAPAPEGPKADSLPLEVTEEAVGDFYGGLFALVATRFGDHWELQDFEKANLAKATKAVLDKYTVKLTPEAMLAVWAGMAIVPRWMMQSQMSKAPEAEVDSGKPKAPEALKPPEAPKAPEGPKAPEAPPAPVKPPERTGWSGSDKDNGH